MIEYLNAGMIERQYEERQITGWWDDIMQADKANARMIR
jgi:hypothetical protein